MLEWEQNSLQKETRRTVFIQKETKGENLIWELDLGKRIMIHEVKIIGRNGKVKKMISSKDLSRDHWKHFKESTDDENVVKLSRGRILRSIREKLDSEFPVE